MFSDCLAKTSDPDTYWLYDLGQLPASVSSSITGRQS